MLNPFKKINIKYQEKFQELKKPSILKVYEELVSGENRFKSYGKATLVICPFHDDSKASMALYEGSNTYNCFACGAHGDSYKMIEERLKIPFVEAVEWSKQI